MLVRLLPIYLLLVLTPITTSWWAAGSNVLDPYQLCKKSKRLRGKMADICNKRQDILKQIKNGVNMGLRECQYQFRNRRWNCTSARRSIKKVLLRDTRETGFVNALLSAGVTYQVTRACTMGELPGCSCDRRSKHKKRKQKHRGTPLPEGDWQWEGCGGENIDYGMHKARYFFDQRFRKRRSDMKTLVRLHNYAAGRLAIRNHMNLTCKCHGLSGSCTLRTCFLRMPAFRVVSRHLRERFDGASKVVPGNDGRSFQTAGATLKPPTRQDLVYSEESPQYCLPEPAAGSLGTRGRQCEEAAQGEEGCGILCCGRDHRGEELVEWEDCRCKFKWCCEVKCEKCRVIKRVSYCL